jgi:hypothetical protein
MQQEEQGEEDRPWRAYPYQEMALPESPEFTEIAYPAAVVALLNNPPLVQVHERLDSILYECSTLRENQVVMATVLASLDKQIGLIRHRMDNVADAINEIRALDMERRVARKPSWVNPKKASAGAFKNERAPRRQHPADVAERSDIL